MLQVIDWHIYLYQIVTHLFSSRGAIPKGIPVWQDFPETQWVTCIWAWEASCTSLFSMVFSSFHPVPIVSESKPSVSCHIQQTLGQKISSWQLLHNFGSFLSVALKQVGWTAAWHTTQVNYGSSPAPGQLSMSYSLFFIIVHAFMELWENIIGSTITKCLLSSK